MNAPRLVLTSFLRRTFIRDDGQHDLSLTNDTALGKRREACSHNTIMRGPQSVQIKLFHQVIDSAGLRVHDRLSSRQAGFRFVDF